MNDIALAANDRTDGRPWEDYPYRCQLNEPCFTRDAETGLEFALPPGWAATRPSQEPMTAGPQQAGVKNALPYVEFYEMGGNLNMMLLNPHQWISDNGACTNTNAGDLCLWRNDAAPNDPAAQQAMATLKESLFFNQHAGGAPQPGANILRRCPPNAPCRFDQPDIGLSGTLPASWSVDVALNGAEGQVSTWFHDVDPAGNQKIIGLNQAGGDPCIRTAAGVLCEHTPYISIDEFDTIARSLRLD